jgi:hypothetical protein
VIELVVSKGGIQMRIFIGALAVALLAGCSSNPISVNDAVQAPRDEIYAFQTKLAGPSAKLTLVRDGGVNASGCDFVIYIDGRKAGKLGSGEKASFYVAPGPINIGAGVSGSGLCVGQSIKTVAATAQPNQQIIYRVGSDMSGLNLGPYVEY